MKVRPHAAVGFHEAVDVRLVLGRRVRGGIVMRAHDAERWLPDRIQQIVVEHVAGAYQVDPRLAQSALGELLEYGGAFAGWDEDEQGIGLGVLHALQERRVIGAPQRRAQ